MLTWIEEFGIHLVLSLLQQGIKNSAKKAALQGLLMSLADDIYVSYGVTPPAHP
jgi:hypothetical protein